MGARGWASGGPVAPAALERTIEAVAGMADEAKRQEVIAIAAVGTAWLRAATDRDEVAEEDRERDGHQRRGGQRRGRGAARLCGELGRTPDRRRERLSCSNGGGSTQFTFGREGTWRAVQRGSSWLTRSGLGPGGRRGDAGRGARCARDRLHESIAVLPPMPSWRWVARLPTLPQSSTRLGGMTQPSSGEGPRPQRGRPPDRDLPVAGRGGAAVDRRPPARTRRGDPGRSVHRQDGDG